MQEVGCCSGKKVHSVERYPGLGGRGPLPSDMSHQKWGMQPRGQNGNGEPVHHDYPIVPPLTWSRTGPLHPIRIGQPRMMLGASLGAQTFGSVSCVF